MIIKPKGTYDLVGLEAKKWQYVNDVVDAFCNYYNYDYIRTPIFESSELFHRDGDESDMVKYQINHASFNSSFESNTETSYQINTTTSQYISMADNYTKSFTPGSSVAFWSVNTYVGKSNIEYAYLGDINKDLILSYNMVKKRPNELITILKSLKEEYMLKDDSRRKKFFYDIRSEFNEKSNLAINRGSLYTLI